MESVFIDSFPGMYASLINYVKYRVNSGKTEIRLLLLFKRYSMSKSIGTKMRLDQMHKAAGGKDRRATYQMAV